MSRCHGARNPYSNGACRMICTVSPRKPDQVVERRLAISGGEILTRGRDSKCGCGAAGGCSAIERRRGGRAAGGFKVDSAELAIIRSLALTSVQLQRLLVGRSRR